MVITKHTDNPPYFHARRYFTLTFLFTFAFWGIGAYLSFSETGNRYYMLFMLAGLITPFAISWLMLRQPDGRGSRRDFLRRTLHPGLIPPNMLPVLLLLMPLSVVTAVALSLLLGESAQQLQFSKHFSFNTGVVPVLLLLLLAAVFEELGWRGYGFESLRGGRTLLWTSLLFGLLWSLWHLPLVIVNGSYQYEIMQQHPWYAVNFFISIIPMGIIISWIYERTSRSVFAAIAFHFITNLSQEALQLTQTTKSIQTAVLVAFAVVFVLYDRERFFSREGIK